MPRSPTWNEDTAREIISLYRKGLSQSAVGQEIGLSQTTVGRILRKHDEPMRSMNGWGSFERRRSGGRYQIASGYFLVHTPKHPHADANGYVFEHRLVMEKVLGRPLKPEEIVHHKNKDRADNRIENLELFADHAAHATHHMKERQCRDGGTGMPVPHFQREAWSRDDGR